MKSYMKHLFAILLIVSIAFSLGGCSKSVDSGALDEKVKEMIDCYAAHDMSGQYSMIYPGIIDQDEYKSVAEELYEYFPVTSGYTLELQQFRATKRVGSSSQNILEGQYKVEFEGKIFYIAVSWQSDKEASGFTAFRAVNEEEWNAAQKK